MTPVVMDGWKEFGSIFAAARWLLKRDGIDATPRTVGNMAPAICRCVHGKQASAYGHTWAMARRGKEGGDD
jgi:hypothetical protein